MHTGKLNCISVTEKRRTNLELLKRDWIVRFSGLFYCFYTYIYVLHTVLHVKMFIYNISLSISTTNNFG
jgi:hypothetical protein